MKLASKIMGLVLAGATAVATTAAVADGMPPSRFRGPVVMPFSWTGFYVGVNAGYAWSDADASSSFSCPVGVCRYTNATNLAAFGAAGSGDLAAEGFTGGVQAGYNWQSGSAVLGVELDYNAFNVNGSRSAGGAIPAVLVGTFGTTAAVDTDWLFTARARLGWTVSPNLLLYVTGGLAVTDARVSNSFADSVAPIAAGASGRSDTLTGWTLGGGLEWAFDRNWSFKTEYLYVDFGSVSTTSSVVTTAGTAANAFATSVDVNAHIARVGINYKF